MIDVYTIHSEDSCTLFVYVAHGTNVTNVKRIIRNNNITYTGELGIPGKELERNLDAAVLTGLDNEGYFIKPAPKVNVDISTE